MEAWEGELLDSPIRPDRGTCWLQSYSTTEPLRNMPALRAPALLQVPDYTAANKKYAAGKHVVICRPADRQSDLMQACRQAIWTQGLTFTACRADSCPP